MHREQAPPGARYFDPTDADALAATLVRASETLAPGPDEDMELRARDDLPRRTGAYATTFLQIAREAVADQSD